MNLSKKVQDVIRFSISLNSRCKYHFSEEPLESIKHIPLEKQQLLSKPIGFWYSWGGTWPLYLLSEFFYLGRKEGKWATNRIENINYIYKVNIDFRDVLRIRRKKDFTWICNEYGKPSTNDMARFADYPYDVNWHKFCIDFKGIDIEYDKNASYDYHWYYGWDCSSGCIWNKDAIKGYKEVWNYKQASL